MSGRRATMILALALGYASQASASDLSVPPYLVCASDADCLIVVSHNGCSISVNRNRLGEFREAYKSSAKRPAKCPKNPNYAPLCVDGLCGLRDSTKNPDKQPKAHK